MPRNQPGTVAARGPNIPQKFYLPVVPNPATPATPSFSNDGGSASFGGIRNTAQIRHAAGDDEFIPSAAIAFDDSDSWWGGVVNCAVQIALAASLSLTSGLTAAAQQPHVQDEIPQTPAGFESGSSASFGGIRYAWQTRYLAGEADWPTPPAAFTPDEDYWQSPVAPPAQALGRVYLPDPDELSTVKLDEDYWANPATPVAATLGHLYLPDGDELPALHSPFEDDSWANPAAPAALTLGQLYLFDSGELPQPAVTIVDEDYWPAQPAPAPSALGSLYLFDSADLPQPSTVDEDYWQLSLPPVPATLGHVYLPDSDDILLPRLVEDYWQTLTPPAQPTFYPYPLGDDSSDLPTLPVTFTPDEDYWQPSSAPVSATLGRAYLPALDDEFVFTAAVTATPEEDYNWTSLPRVGNNSGSGNALLNYLGLPLGEGDGFISTPAPPGAAAIDERYTYDRYSTGLYLTGHTSIGEDL